MNAVQNKNVILFTLSMIGSFVVSFLGGVDAVLIALMLFMAVDYITGLAVALIFHKSKKTTGGGASSKECLKGIIKKLCMLLLVGLAHELDVIMGVDYTRTMAILFLIGNEGLSVLENMGLMGIKYPAFLIKALESLKDENGGDNDE
jgi:toxin secretion/phage lysis holin